MLRDVGVEFDSHPARIPGRRIPVLRGYAASNSGSSVARAQDRSCPLASFRQFGGPFLQASSASVLALVFLRGAVGTEA